MTRDFQLEPILSLDLGSPIGQMRAAPVRVGGQTAILAVYCADFDVDPFVEMFFFPTDTLKMALFTPGGEVLWRRDLGPGVVPGVWFCPVLPFDLDGDGDDEIWFVNNTNPQHPLALSTYTLARVDAGSGEITGQWPWPHKGRPDSLSHTFRNFIVGGHVRGEPVLVTAQGTYGDMFQQAYNADMSVRWERAVMDEDPGARGSHMCPVFDLRGEGVDVLMWGERAISLDAGEELFCAARDSYRGHSDIIQPIWTGERWLFYTCREGDAGAAPRVVMYDDKGEFIWGDVDQGHMDMGWAARLKPDRGYVTMAIRIGHKTAGPDGRFHQDRTEFTFDAQTGKPYALPFSVYRTLPVDLNGDGYHELVRGIPGGDGEVFTREGRVIGSVGGTVAMVSKFVPDLPGEQILSYHAGGDVQVWADRAAEDSDEALARYANPFYDANMRLTATGYNLMNVSGV